MTVSETELLLYTSPTWSIKIDARLEKESFWLNLNQIAHLFDKDKSTISRHMKKIIETWELEKNSVVANNATTAADGKTYNVDYYNLDMIISVWYRVNSIQATHFRKWATSVLKKHVTQWYTLNHQRLEQTWLEWLKQSFDLIQRALTSKELSHDETQWVLHLIMTYLPWFLTMNKFDQKSLNWLWQTSEEFYKIERLDAVVALANLKSQLIAKWEATESFAHPKNDWWLDACFSEIYQTDNWVDVYSTVEEKAATLFYLIIKNLPFIDWNKRSWSYLFIWYLHKNKLLKNNNGKEKISHQTMVALALLIAHSDSTDRESIISLVVTLLR